MMKILKTAWLMSAMYAGLAQAGPQTPAPVVDMSRSLGDVSSAVGKPGPSTQAMFEVMGRLEQLQNEIQQLRGQVEEQGYALETLKKSQRDMYLDLDHRMQQLQSGQLPADSVPEGDFGAEEPAAETPPVPSQEPAATPMERVPGTPEEGAAYRDAYDTLQAGRQREAVALLQSFIASYPNGEYADNARYWLGEAYYATRDFGPARQHFQEVIRFFPNSRKVPDAMLKLGYIAYEEGRLNDARDQLSRVVARYPDTTAARLADNRLAHMSQESR